jgi:hypothetical protein
LQAYISLAGGNELGPFPLNTLYLVTPRQPNEQRPPRPRSKSPPRSRINNDISPTKRLRSNDTSSPTSTFSATGEDVSCTVLPILPEQSLVENLHPTFLPDEQGAPTPANSSESTLPEDTLPEDTLPAGIPPEDIPSEDIPSEDIPPEGQTLNEVESESDGSSVDRQQASIRYGVAKALSDSYKKKV